MRESIVWQNILKAKPDWLEIERFEVLHPPGGSDCFFTDTRSSLSGWLELKFCKEDDREWRAGRIPKLKPEQPMFLRRQSEKGIPAGILMRYADHGWYLWTAKPDHEWVNQIRSTDARSLVTLYRSNLDIAEMVEVLTVSRCAR